MNGYEDKYKELVNALGYDVDAIDIHDMHETLLKVVSTLQKVKTAMITSKPETFPSLFITGMTGHIDDLGMPDYLTICPHFGMAGFAVYKKEKSYSEPGW